MTKDTVLGLFDELEKIGGLGTAIAAKAVQHPGAAYWRFHQQKKGLSKHKQTLLALKHGYPVGWVSMNMRPG